MVSQATQSFVLEVLDFQLDFNIKLIMFGVIIFYVFLLNHMRKHLQIDSFSKMVFSLFSGIYVYTSAFFLPLFTIMLFRDYAAIELWTLIWQAYSLVFIITTFALMILGWQKVLDVVGIDFNLGISKRDQKRKGEE